VDHSCPDFSCPCELFCTVQLELALDSNDLARLNGFDVREADEHVWQEVFQTVRLRKENDYCDTSASQILLIFDTLIYSKENFKLRCFRCR
jgi:hypothetical protein